MVIRRLKPPRIPDTDTVPPKGNALVIAPHADDEIIGCGGAIALHAAQGDSVQVLVMTSGVGGDPDQHYTAGELRAIRQNEARAGGAVLGAGEYVFWGYPDSYEVTESDVAMLAGNLHRHLKEVRPANVYYPWIGEAHSDHWIGGLVTRRALRGLPFDVRALGYEVWTPCVPNFILDVSGVYDRKVKALEEHKSQLRYKDHVTATMAMNRHRSVYFQTGATHGEAYLVEEYPACR